MKASPSWELPRVPWDGGSQTTVSEGLYSPLSLCTSSHKTQDHSSESLSQISREQLPHGWTKREIGARCEDPHFGELQFSLTVKVLEVPWWSLISQGQSPS